MPMPGSWKTMSSVPSAPEKSPAENTSMPVTLSLVLVSEPVAYEAETRFTLEELAPLELKGKANVVQVYRVTGFRDSDSTESVEHDSNGPF